MEDPKGTRDGNGHAQRVPGYFSKKVLIVLGITLLVLLPLLWVGWMAEVFLLFLMSVLLALVLRGLGDWVASKTGWSEKVCLTIVLLLLVGLIAAGAWFLSPEISRQMEELRTQIPKAAAHAFDQVKATSWGKNLLGDVSLDQQMKDAGPQLLGKVGNILSLSLTVITYTALVVFVALYLSYDPCAYVNGFVGLFPKPRRPRVRTVLNTMGAVMRRDMIGRLLLMLLNAIITTLTLWALGIPMALTLGILTGLLNFIPNIGPVLGAVPAILVAMMQGTDKAMYVAIFYISYQMIDGYLLSPMVQKKAVSLAPAITIMAQVLLGLSVGPMGVLMAVPICTIALVLVKLLYIEDVLGETAEIPGA